MNTLLLDRSLWDLVLDANGDIAMASPPYAIAQDVASAVKTNAGEVYYDTTLGVPYDRILGKTPPLQTIKAAILKEANRVPGVAASVCYLAETGRALSGQVRVTTDAGNTNVVAF